MDKLLKVYLYNTVAEAKEETGANVFSSLCSAPFGRFYFEAADADLDMVICITEHIPVVTVKVALLRRKKTRLVGPNCPGVITADECKIGASCQDISIKRSCRCCITFWYVNLRSGSSIN